MANFDEKDLKKWETDLVDLGFKKSKDELKKGVPAPYHMGEKRWRVITYEHPSRQEKVKISVIEGVMMVQANGGKKQRTAWENLHNIEELRQHFKL
jgi:hypothetical protein